MEVAEKAEALAAGQQNRRAAPRYGVEGDASLLLVNHGSTISCRIVDLSLSGCRLRTQERFLAGMMVRVEAAFKVRGLVFRFSGVTQWTDGRHLVGIRFVDVPMRRREELVEALGEVEAEIAAKAAKHAVEEQAAAQLAAERQDAAVEADAAPVAGQPERETPRPSLVPAPVPALAIAVPANSLPQALPVLPKAAGPQPAKMPKGEALLAGSPQASFAKRERRVQSRHEVDTSAVIYLINVASQLPGRILDLSLGGCRICTDERFPVGIYTRVETEFRLEGLPFRLGGVIQAIHDRRQVGIRFLDMSSRKREQVEQLIEEIRSGVKGE
jgi:hypothetical protein